MYLLSEVAAGRMSADLALLVVEQTDGRWEGPNPAVARLLGMAGDMRREMTNARMRLDGTGFDEELAILDTYLQILLADTGILAVELIKRGMLPPPKPGQQRERTALEEEARDVELRPAVPDRPLSEHLAHLFREIALEIADRPGATLAVSEFAMKGGKRCALVDLINDAATNELAALGGVKVVERERLAAALAEQDLAVSDLVDTERARRIGSLLSAGYIVTGTVIEMSRTVVIFGRIINVDTGEVETAAQVVVPRGDDVERLLI